MGAGAGLLDTDKLEAVRNSAAELSDDDKALVETFLTINNQKSVDKAVELIAQRRKEKSEGEKQNKVKIAKTNLQKKVDGFLASKDFNAAKRLVENASPDIPETFIELLSTRIENAEATENNIRDAELRTKVETKIIAGQFDDAKNEVDIAASPDALKRELYAKISSEKLQKAKNDKKTEITGLINNKKYKDARQAIADASALLTVDEAGQFEQRISDKEREISGKKSEGDQRKAIQGVEEALASNNITQAEQYYRDAISAGVDAATLATLDTKIKEAKKGEKESKDATPGKVKAELLAKLDVNHDLNVFYRDVDARGPGGSDELSAEEVAVTKKEGQEKVQQIQKDIESNSEVIRIKEDLFSRLDVGQINDVQARAEVDANITLTSAQKNYLNGEINKRFKLAGDIGIEGQEIKNPGSTAVKFDRLRDKINNTPGISDEMKQALMEELTGVEGQFKVSETVDKEKVALAEAKKLQLQFEKAKKIIAGVGGVLAVGTVGLGVGALLGGVIVPIASAGGTISAASAGWGIVGAGGGWLAGTGLAATAGGAAGMYKYYFGGGMVAHKELNLKIAEQDSVIAKVKAEKSGRSVAFAKGEVDLMARLFAAQTGRNPNEMIKMWEKQFGVENIDDLYKAVKQMASSLNKEGNN